VVINKQNVSKKAMLHPEWGTGKKASWTSKYGSVTFNFASRELPWGGMNEVGLVAASMMLNAAEYPDPDSRPAIFAGQWLQYQLDNFSTVQEVLASDSKIRMAPNGPAKAHFFVSDMQGNCAVIEFIDGKMIYYNNETLPVKALTNSTYAESIEYWKKGQAPNFDPFSSLGRFITAADMVKAYDSKAPIDYAFDILNEVAQGTVEEIDGVSIRSMAGTEWSIVYDIKNLRVYFRTFDNKKIRYVDMSSFDFSCKTPVKVLDIQEDFSEDVSSKFINYTNKINREFIRKTLRDSDEVKEYIAKYPDTTVCTE
jgi:choloylglycine hydrolase